MFDVKKIVQIVWQHRNLCCKVAGVQRVGQEWHIFPVKKCKKKSKMPILLRFAVPFGRKAEGEENLVHFFCLYVSPYFFVLKSENHADLS